MAGTDFLYEQITNTFMDMLDKGTVPWQMPWNNNQAFNPVSHTKYRGINPFLLFATAQKRGFKDFRWLTKNQVLGLGGYIKKEEFAKSTFVVFWKFIPVDKDKAGKPVAGGKTIPYLRYYNVYNVEQCEGLDKLPSYESLIAAKHDGTALEAAENVLRDMPNKPTIQFGGNEAYYMPSRDLVQMPDKLTFKNMESFYAVFFHELAHSTGNENRLKRDGVKGNVFGNNDYSKEELVAEFTSAFLCGHVGIDNVKENSAAYLASWLKVLKGDKMILVRAAGQAQKAADYILNVKHVDKEATE